MELGLVDGLELILFILSSSREGATESVAAPPVSPLRGFTTRKRPRFLGLTPQARLCRRFAAGNPQSMPLYHLSGQTASARQWWAVDRCAILSHPTIYFWSGTNWM